MGKLLQRLFRAIEQTGGLSVRQYGFRKDCFTLDVIMIVKDMTEKAGTAATGKIMDITL